MRPQCTDESTYSGSRGDARWQTMSWLLPVVSTAGLGSGAIKYTRQVILMNYSSSFEAIRRGLEEVAPMFMWGHLLGFWG